MMEDPAAAFVLASGCWVQLELPADELAGHIRHAVADVAPTETEYVPALQLMHENADVAPTEAEYVPALQLMHSEAPTPAYLPA